MNRSELIADLVKSATVLTVEHAEQIVDVIFEEITEQLAAGGRVELRGFAAFWTVERQARTGRDPRSGAEVIVPVKRKVRFRASNVLLRSLHDGATERGDGEMRAAE